MSSPIDVTTRASESAADSRLPGEVDMPEAGDRLPGDVDMPEAGDRLPGEVDTPVSGTDSSGGPEEPEAEVPGEADPPRELQADCAPPDYPFGGGPYTLGDGGEGRRTPRGGIE